MNAAEVAVGDAGALDKFTNVQFADIVVQAMSACVMTQVLGQRGNRNDHAQCLAAVLQLLDQCITARPRNAAVHIMKGNALMQAGEPGKGLVSLIEGLRLDPVNCFNAHYTMGNIYINMAGHRRCLLYTSPSPRDS